MMSRRIPVEDAMPRSTEPTRHPRVVIVGAGFGGLAAAKSLAGGPFDVTVVDRHNYHLFQPLLYQVATAGLSPADIAAPIRGILRGRTNISVQLAKVLNVDAGAQSVITDRRAIPYDHLILATGARHAYFGHDEWEPAAPGLKRIDDATELRRRILLAFETAETEVSAEEHKRLLTFVVVGGGATGVEMAGAIAELAKKALAADFRNVDPREASIVLVEAGPRLLPSFDERLSEYARQALQSLGVTVILGAAVTACDASGVAIGERRIDSRTIVWAAGVRASPAGKWLDAPADAAGRVFVNPDLSVPGHPDIFAIGDTAHVADANGRPLPGVATVAKQQGRYVAKLLKRQTRGLTVPPFRYRDPGSLATIGRSRAVAEIMGFRLTGLLAWLLWSFVHIYFLIGFRNRLVVALSWAWSYITFERGSRLITGADGAQPPPASTTGEPRRMRNAA
jgi:NADH:ubiquinone reductase (H+-translocating)